MRDYAQALGVHQSILALYPVIGRARVRFRTRDRPVRSIPQLIVDSAHTIAVDRDRTICALALKAATTKESIARLCEEGFSDDAFALSRVLIENSIVLGWLLHDDRATRIDTYCLYTATVRDRWRELVDKHYQDDPAMQAAAQTGHPAADASIAEELFDDRYYSWALFRQQDGTLARVRLSQMMSSMSSTPNAPLFLHEAVYFDASHWIHSSPPSIVPFARMLASDSMYLLRASKDNSHRTVAMDLSNVAMLFVLSMLNDFLTLGIGDELQNILDSIKASDAGLAAET